MRAHITKIGNWPAFARLAKNLTKELHNARILSLKRWGLKAEAISKGHLSSQDLANSYWAPLSTKYTAWKASEGFSTNTLVMSSTYFQNITTWVDVVQGDVYVGVKTGRYYKIAHSRGIELADIARLHEYGSHNGNIPARPLWEPTLNETMKWHIESKNRPGDIFLHIIRTKYI